MNGLNAVADDKSVEGGGGEGGLVAAAGHVAAYGIDGVVQEVVNVVAAGEDVIGNLGDSGADGQGVESSAVAKGPVADDGNVVGDGDGAEGGATFEGHVADDAE